LDRLDHTARRPRERVNLPGDPPSSRRPPRWSLTRPVRSGSPSAELPAQVVLAHRPQGPNAPCFASENRYPRNRPGPSKTVGMIGRPPPVEIGRVGRQFLPPVAEESIDIPDTSSRGRGVAIDGAVRPAPAGKADSMASRGTPCG